MEEIKDFEKLKQDITTEFSNHLYDLVYFCDKIPVVEKAASDKPQKIKIQTRNPHAENIGHGLCSYLSMSIANFLIGEYASFRSNDKLIAKIPEDLSLSVSKENVLESIISLIKTAKENYNQTYDRLLLSSYIFRLIYEKHFSEDANGNHLPMGCFTLVELQQKLADMLGLIIEINDTTYWIKDDDGSKKRVRYLPRTHALLVNDTDQYKSDSKISSFEMSFDSLEVFKDSEGRINTELTYRLAKLNPYCTALVVINDAE